jgi:hypothetical protein
LSQVANLFSSVQMRAISSRLYRGIMGHLAWIIHQKPGGWRRSGNMRHRLIILRNARRV